MPNIADEKASESTTLVHAPVLHGKRATQAA
jgi:hypothetical protein